MGVEAYIDIKLYNSTAEKEKIHHTAFNKFDKYIQFDNYDNSSDFNEDDWFKNEINFDKEIYVTPTDAICNLVRSKPSFIPEEVARYFYKKYQNDILCVLPEHDYDGLRKVKLEKEDILLIIQNLCLDVARKYECQIDTLFLKTYKKDDSSFMAFILDNVRQKIESEVREWKYTSKAIQFDANGNLKLPYTIAWSYYYQIMELIHLINDYDWSRIDVVLYCR